MTLETLTVAEIFGPTFQGEGPSTGRISAFLRLGACNLNCSWCDTPYSWDWSGELGQKFDPHVELRKLSFAEVYAELEAKHVDRLVVTGGEPLLQQSALGRFLTCRPSSLHAVELETNGTIQPDQALVEQVSHFNVSPKLSNSGIPHEKRIRPLAVRAFHETGKASFKFVVREPSELQEIAELFASIGLTGADVWVMPEGTTAEVLLDRMRMLAPLVLERGWNLTGRLQVLLWDARRGM